MWHILHYKSLVTNIPFISFAPPHLVHVYAVHFMITVVVRCSVCITQYQCIHNSRLNSFKSEYSMNSHFCHYCWPYYITSIATWCTYLFIVPALLQLNIYLTTLVLSITLVLSFSNMHKHSSYNLMLSQYNISAQYTMHISSPQRRFWCTPSYTLLLLRINISGLCSIRQNLLSLCVLLLLTKLPRYLCVCAVAAH